MSEQSKVNSSSDTLTIEEALKVKPLLEVSEQKPLAQLIDALAQAQAEIFNPVKNRRVDVQMKENKGKYGYEYAELNVVTEIIRLPLSKNGLSYTQSPVEGPRGWDVLTVLMHKSGETKDFHYPLYVKAGMSEEHGFAAGFTYAKRQALKGIFGIADDTEDTDGQDPKKVIITPITQAEPLKNHAPKPDELDNALKDSAEKIELMRQLQALIKQAQIPRETFNTIVAEVCGQPRKWNELSENELQAVLAYIENKL